MNPKSINDLDPKLKETYERVMGTSFGTEPKPAPTMETQPVEQTPPQASVTPQPQAPASLPSENSTVVSQVFRADNTDKSTETATVNALSKKETAAKKNGNKTLMIIVGVGAVVFFAVYAVIWAKLLGLF
jgi:hypothetical protein